MKKIRLPAAALLLALCLLLSSCNILSGPLTSAPSGSAPDITVTAPDITVTAPDNTGADPSFDDFVNTLFIEDVISDSLTLHFTLAHPENYGIDNFAATWGDLSVTPSAAYLDQHKTDKEAFAKFDRSALSPAQQITYDVVKSNLDLYDTEEELYYYDEPLINGDGVHAALPTNMSEYMFDSEQDIKDYLTLCGTWNDYFSAVIGFEKEKVKQGLFMTDSNLDEVVKECQTFLSKTDDNVLITSFNNRVDACGFLTADQKAGYKQQNQDTFNSVIVPAYHQLITGLQSLRGSGVNSKGLAGFPQEKAYYAYRLKEMGVSMTPEELIAYCENMIDSTVNEIQSLYQKNKLLKPDAVIAPSGTPTQLVDYLKQKAAADFPSLPADTQYTIQNVDSSLADASRPAFYFPPQLDNYQNNRIYINPTQLTDKNDTFTTLAHEGYPGHLEQCVTYNRMDIPNYRKVQSLDAVNEGWATYAQYAAYGYGTGSRDVAAYVKDNYMAGMLVQFRCELGVSYQGWSLQDFTKYINQIYNETTTASDNQDFYNFFVNNPCATAPYYAGYFELLKLRDAYQAQQGSAYSDKAFNTTFLAAGPAPFAVIGEVMGVS